MWVLFKNGDRMSFWMTEPSRKSVLRALPASDVDISLLFKGQGVKVFGDKYRLKEVYKGFDLSRKVYKIAGCY